jgi:hypothetical protein
VVCEGLPGTRAGVKPKDLDNFHFGKDTSTDVH